MSSLCFPSGFLLSATWEAAGPGAWVPDPRVGGLAGAPGSWLGLASPQCCGRLGSKSADGRSVSLACSLALPSK